MQNWKAVWKTSPEQNGRPHGHHGCKLEGLPKGCPGVQVLRAYEGAGRKVLVCLVTAA